MNNIFTTFENVIESVRKGELGCYDLNDSYKDNPVYFDVYWHNTTSKTPTLEDEVYVGEPSEVDDDVLYEDYDFASQPAQVKERHWWLAYSDELIEDVLSNALAQKLEATNQELLEAIEHYSKHDTFISL